MLIGNPSVGFMKGGGFKLTGASYANNFFSVNTQETGPNAVAISLDGTKIYVGGVTADTVFQYTLSTPFNASTAVYASKSMASGNADIKAMAFKSDGITLFLDTATTGQTIRQYTLSTPWDISSGSYASKSFSAAAEDTAPRGIWVNAAGTRMYVVGTTTLTIYQYTLGTPWDVSTASYASKSKLVSGVADDPTGVFFSPDEKKMFVSNNNADKIHEYDVGTAGDVSTAVYNSVFLDVSAQTTVPTDLCFDISGLNLYVVDNAGVGIYQYSTPG